LINNILIANELICIFSQPEGEKQQGRKGGFFTSSLVKSLVLLYQDEEERLLERVGDFQVIPSYSLSLFNFFIGT